MYTIWCLADDTESLWISYSTNCSHRHHLRRVCSAHPWIRSGAGSENHITLQEIVRSISRSLWVYACGNWAPAESWDQEFSGNFYVSFALWFSTHLWAAANFTQLTKSCYLLCEELLDRSIHPPLANCAGPKHTTSFCDVMFLKWKLSAILSVDREQWYITHPHSQVALPILFWTKQVFFFIAADKENKSLLTDVEKTVQSFERNLSSLSRSLLRNFPQAGKAPKIQENELKRKFVNLGWLCIKLKVCQQRTYSLSGTVMTYLSQLQKNLPCDEKGNFQKQ